MASLSRQRHLSVTKMLGISDQYRYHFKYPALRLKIRCPMEHGQKARDEPASKFLDKPRNAYSTRSLVRPETVICCTDDLCYCSASRPHPSLARESAESGVIFIRLLRIKPRIQRTIETLETCCSQRMICKKLSPILDPVKKDIARESEHAARLPEPTFVVLVCCMSWPETRAEPCVFWTVFQVYKVTLSLSPPRNPVKVAGKNNFDYTKDPGGNRRCEGYLGLV
uniref:Uncharacterized protein n=1 Tax=Coccidioides posadasii RMSCC 3488 TaxID=454284 RepID=A0A0J6FVA7_COCPO|nr:hypothetical protein CPAG_09664 [Coccidioides posadasii RMSCC 3488]